jgi:AcrR family transcriptional regulator
MREKLSENTEEKILEAAKEIFVREGKSGARMQEIADKAGINKSLLHYYYRSKEKLFYTVFKFVFSKFAHKIINLFDADKDIFEVIEQFIDNYIDLIRKNPFIPMFIINEINRKETSFVTEVIRETGINIDTYFELIQRNIDLGKIKAVDPKQLIINILSLCIFPIISRPIVQIILYDDNKNAYDKFLDQRKKEVNEIIFTMIKPN